MLLVGEHLRSMTQWKWLLRVTFQIRSWTSLPGVRVWPLSTASTWAGIGHQLDLRTTTLCPGLGWERVEMKFYCWSWRDCPPSWQAMIHYPQPLATKTDVYFCSASADHMKTLSGKGNIESAFLGFSIPMICGQCGDQLLLQAFGSGFYCSIDRLFTEV